MANSFRTKKLGGVFVVLLPSVKMKSVSPRGTSFERELHQLFLKLFEGYTVTSGNITGYWMKLHSEEECNEHRRYEIASSDRKKKDALKQRLARLAAELGEESIFCQEDGAAFLIYSNQSPE